MKELWHTVLPEGSVVDPDSLNPDPVQHLRWIFILIQFGYRVWWLQIEEKNLENFLKIVCDQKLQFTYPQASIKGVQATE